MQLEGKRRMHRCFSAMLFLALLFQFLVSRKHRKGWFRGGYSGSDRIEASPLLADLNGDGRMEDHCAKL